MEMAEDAWFRANVRSCDEVGAVFQCLEAAFLLIVRQVGQVCKACLTLGLPPRAFGARFHLTASHVDWKEEGWKIAVMLSESAQCHG